jgi:hypothetical protein
MAGEVTETSGTQRLPADPPEEAKIPFWKRPFKKKEPPPPPQEVIVEVGPRQYPVTPGPLLRLPRALKLAPGQVIPPGFYLVRQQQTDDNQRLIYLYQGSQFLSQVTLKAIADQAAEPVESLDKEAPPPQHIEATLINHGQQLIITLNEGKKRYQSDPLPVLGDRRPQLKF